MIYTLVFGGDERGWTYLAFEADKGRPQQWHLVSNAMEQFEKDVAGCCDAVARQFGDRKFEKQESIDAFVKLLTGEGGYRLVESIGIVSTGPNMAVILSCAPGGPHIPHFKQEGHP